MKNIDTIRLALEYVTNDGSFEKLCKECQERVKEARKAVDALTVQLRLLIEL